MCDAATSQAAVPFAAGVFNFCLAGRRFGLDLIGRKPAGADPATRPAPSRAHAGYSQIVTSQKGTRSEEAAGQRGATGGPPSSSSGPDRSTVAAAACAPRRFASAEEAARDVANVLWRGPLLTRAYTGGLDSQLRERVMVAVSQVNACGGCTRVHRSWALRSGW